MTGCMLVTICHVIAVAPRNLQISPRRSTYRPGEKLSCTAEGNPLPSYQWSDVENVIVASGSNLIIDYAVNATTYTFRCTAINHFNGKYHTVTDTITFAVTGNVKTSKYNLTIIVLISILFTIYSICVEKYHCRWRKMPQRM